METAFIRASWRLLFHVVHHRLGILTQCFSTSTLHRMGSAFVYRVTVPEVETDCHPATNDEVKKCAIETEFLH